MISIVIPLFNKAQTVRRAVLSAAKGWPIVNEIIVIDDGSSDGSADIVEEIWDPHAMLTLVRQANLGVSATRNRGLSLAKNHYISFLDADDEHLDGYAKTMANLIETFPGAVAYSCKHAIYRSGYGSYVPDKGSPSTEKLISLRDYRESECELINSSKITVNKSFFLKAGGFPESAMLCEDIFLWMMLFRQGEVAYSPFVLSKVYVEPDLSRQARVRQVPYPIRYFSKNKQSLTDCEYELLWFIHIRHLMGSLASGDKEEFKLRISFAQSLFGARQIPLYFLLFLPTSFFYILRRFRGFVRSILTRK